MNRIYENADGTRFTVSEADHQLRQTAGNAGLLFGLISAAFTLAALGIFIAVGLAFWMILALVIPTTMAAVLLYHYARTWVRAAPAPLFASPHSRALAVVPMLWILLMLGLLLAERHSAWETRIEYIAVGISGTALLLLPLGLATLVTAHLRPANPAAFRPLWLGQGYLHILQTAIEAIRGAVPTLTTWLNRIPAGGKFTLRGIAIFVVVLASPLLFLCLFFGLIFSELTFLGIAGLHGVLWALVALVRRLRGSAQAEMICPTCDTEHTALRPGPNGILGFRCRCGARIAFRGLGRSSNTTKDEAGAVQ